MEYQVLIFMTEKSLSAVETVSENDCEIISIDGNETMEYQEEKDIRKFCDCIKEYYSIDEFSDLEMEIDLVYGNTEKQYLTYLINQVTGCDKFSVIELKKILPVILLQRKMIRKSEAVLVAFLGESYLVQCDNTLRIMVEKTVDNGAGERIQYEDFSLLFYFDAKKLSDDFGDSKVNERNILKIEAIEKQLDEKNKQIGVLEREKNIAILQLNQANQQISEIEAKMHFSESTISMLEQDKADLILKLDYFLEGKRVILALKKSECGFLKDYILEQQFEDGDYLEEGNCVVRLKPLSKIHGSCIKVCTTPYSGKIFWLIDDKIKLSSTDKLKKEYIDVAIICDKIDTRDNVKKWYHSSPKAVNKKSEFCGDVRRYLSVGVIMVPWIV